MLFYDDTNFPRICLCLSTFLDKFVSLLPSRSLHWLLFRFYSKATSDPHWRFDFPWTLIRTQYSDRLVRFSGNLLHTARDRLRTKHGGGRARESFPSASSLKMHDICDTRLMQSRYWHTNKVQERQTLERIPSDIHYCDGGAAFPQQRLIDSYDTRPSFCFFPMAHTYAKP